MLSNSRQLKPAQEEVRRTAHDQDLVEVPRRARLDRERENRNPLDEIPKAIVTGPQEPR